MKRIKKILASLMVAVMVLTAAPLSGFVGLKLPNLFSLLAGAVVYDGTCGYGASWTLDAGTGELYINGSGEMFDFEMDYETEKCDSPWASIASKIKSVVISNGVTSIGSWSFLFCNNLTKVTIPDSVSYIGDGAFAYCERLTDIELPQQMYYIGPYAFAATSINSIRIPDGIEELYELTFADCLYLKNLKISNSLLHIDEWAFDGCNVFENFYFDGSLSEWCRKEYFYSYAFYSDKLYINGNLIEGELVIPNGVNRIGAGAFSRTGVTSVKFPDSVVEIGVGAFGECDDLKAIMIPDRVETIEEKAFVHCDSLRNVTIGKGVKFIGERAFGDCANLTEITIPDNVTTIEGYAFENSGLINVIIGDSVASIGEDAFCGCPNILELTIPISTQIGRGAFQDSEKIKTITITAGNGTYQEIALNYDEDGIYYEDLPWNISEAPIVIFAEGVENIHDNTFYDSTTLTELYIPSSLGYYDIFNGLGDCNRLKFIGVSANHESLSSDIHGVVFDDEKKILAFYPKGKEDKIYEIPNGITTIYDLAFTDCDNLTNVIIPDTVTSIGEYAFKDCVNLSNITIPDSVTEICEDAFYNTGYYNNSKNWVNDVLYNGQYLLEAKKNVNGTYTIKKNTKLIADCAFIDCDELCAIKIPNTVTDIGYRAFASCSNFTDVFYVGTEKEWENISISIGNFSDVNIHFISSQSLILNCEKRETINNVCPYISVVNYPAGYSEDDIVWSSSNETVAVIGEDGTVYPRLYGKTIIRAETSDGRYSAECELTVKASFVLSSSTGNVRGIKFGETEKFVVYLLDSEGNKLSVENVDISGIEDCNNIKITNLVKNDDCITFDVKGVAEGTDEIKFKDSTTQSYNCYTINVFPESKDYMASKVPNVGETGKVNFKRSDMVVEDFNYTYNKDNDSYTATMTVYNESGALGALVAYNAEGTIVDYAIVDGHEGMATSWFDYIGMLGKGVYDIAAGNLMSNIHRNSLYYTKNEISVEVPADGYITLSNDINTCPVAATYNIFSIAVDTAITTVNVSKEVIDASQSKKVTKALVEEVLKDVPDSSSFMMDLWQESLRFAVSSSAPDLTLNAELAIDMADKACKRAGKNFEEYVVGVVYKVCGVTIFNMCTKGMMIYFIKKGFINKVGKGALEKAEAFFTAGDVLNLANKILCVTIFNRNDGATTIQFRSCGEEGFVCKDTVKVVSDFLNADSLLQHYVIHNTHQLKDTKTQLSLKENDVVQLHEIAVYENDELVEFDQFVRVEIEYTIPKGCLPMSIKILRVEPDGTYTDMQAVYQDGKLIFQTEHFSEYIVVCEADTAYFEVAGGAEVETQDDVKCIVGLQPSLTRENFEDTYADFENVTVEYDMTTSHYLGTGSTVTTRFVSTGAVFEEQVIVIFGDVNGDSWYDGQDAIIVDCLANGMLTKDDVSEAVYMAADCNHDGVIDEADVALLNEAGMLLTNVDQTKPAEVLLETSAAYVEYLDLIDQSPELDIEDETDAPEADAETEDTTPEQDAKVDIFKMIMNFIKSIFEMLLSYIPMPIK